MTEAERIARIARIVGAAPAGSRVRTGIGDDAAVLASPPESHVIVWTIDEQVEGVHFRREWLAWRDVGWRSTMAAVSDVAAMGAAAWCMLAALVLPSDVDDAALDELVRGQREAAQATGAPLIGGNLSRGTTLSIATTVLGTCVRAVERRGAREGDGLWLAGSVGLAAAGLRALERGQASDPRLALAVEAWRAPVARLAEGSAMSPVAHAAVDVSDGLARDAGHLAEASGVCAVLDEAALLADASLVAAAAALAIAPLDLALHGGEDYALVLAGDVPVAGFRRIGDVRAGRGVVLRGDHGDRPIAAEGFDHWR